MLSIGEFARLAGVSVRMLRHYDQLGLLQPASVDPSSGYRSYSPTQLDRANRLVALKELGFSLATIGELLDGAPEALLRDRMSQRRDELREQIDADRARLRQVEARLRLIEKEQFMSTFTVIPLPELHVAQLSEVVDDQSEIGSRIGPMFDRLMSALSASGVDVTGAAVATYTVLDRGMQIAAAAPIDQTTAPDGLTVETLAAAPSALSVRYESDVIDDIVGAWQCLVMEADERGLTRVGVGREVYLATPGAGGDRWVVELQQPVA